MKVKVTIEIEMHHNGTNSATNDLKKYFKYNCTKMLNNTVFLFKPETLTIEKIKEIKNENK